LAENSFGTVVFFDAAAISQQMFPELLF